MKVAVVGQGPLSWARFSKKQLRGGEGVLLPLRPLKLKNSEKLLQVPLCNDAKEIFPSPVLTVSRAWASPRAIRTPKLPCLDWIHSCYHLCHRITPVLFPAATCQKVPRLPSLQIDVVWTPEVRWLHSHSVCTALKKNPQSGSTREIILQCPRSLLGLSPWWEPARGIEGSAGHVSIRGKSLVMGAWEDLQQCGVPHEYKILLRSTLSKELLSALWTLGYIPHSPPWPYSLRPAPLRPRHSLRSHLSKLADHSSDRELGDLHI